MFAQDEQQVAEHPELTSIFLMARDIDLNIRTEDDSEYPIIFPTPVLASGIERRLSIETVKSGLYGNAFQDASLSQVISATTKLEQPSISNILAMRAPECAEGFYKAEDIRQILVTAYTGFYSIIVESRYLRGTDILVHIHSGFWGCGAYGGNRTLMLLLQMLAASLAGISKLTFHLGDEGNQDYFVEAHGIYDRLSSEAWIPLEIIISELAEMDFAWGVSDGN